MDAINRVLALCFGIATTVTLQELVNQALGVVGTVFGAVLSWFIIRYLEKRYNKNKNVRTLQK